MKFLILLLLAITASAEFEDSGSGSGSGSTEFEDFGSGFGSGEIQGSGYENEVKDIEFQYATPGYEQETITTSPMDTTDESHDLNCGQYEGYDDECHIRQAWTCQYTEWRLNFYTVWLKMFVEYRMYHEGSGTEIPTCSVPEDMVNCANEGMKVCMSSSVLPDCPICYCADHVYQNVNELRDIWRTDYQEWSHLMKQWEEDASAANQHQNNDSSNHGECH